MSRAHDEPGRRDREAPLRRSVIVIALLVLLAPATVRAQTEPAPPFKSTEAARRYQAAAHAFQAQDYDRAIAEAQSGNALELRVEFLYLLGQSERMRQNCRKAVEHYEAALALASSHAQIGAIRIQIQRCEKVLPKEPTAPASAGAGPPAVPSPNASDAAALPTTAVQSLAPRRPWFRDPAGGALLGGGLAVLAVGAGLFGASEGAIRDANIDSQHYADAHRMQPMQIAGISMLAVGAGAVAAGVLRYAWVVRRAR